MKQLKCLAIDDEPMALEIIEEYVEKIPYLSLEKSIHNPIEAISYLKSHELDLIFLDINMPDLSGIQLLNTLRHPPMVIFTSAHSEYGVESYNHEAIDYLLKPIEFDRFLLACNRVLDKTNLSNKSVVSESTIKNIKSGNQIFRIDLNDVQYIEGSGNYVTYHLSGEKIMSLQNMNSLEAELPKKLFTRVHRSFILGITHIKSVEPHRVILNDQSIPIGKSYRKDFMNQLGI